MPEAKNARHQCQLCFKVFARAFTLKNHLPVHTGNQPFACTSCPKRFARNHDRKVHEGEQHSAIRRAHRCHGQCGSSDCARSFSRKTSLNRHIKNGKSPGLEAPLTNRATRLPWSPPDGTTVGGNTHVDSAPKMTASLPTGTADLLGAGNGGIISGNTIDLSPGDRSGNQMLLDCTTYTPYPKSWRCLACSNRFARLHEYDSHIDKCKVDRSRCYKVWMSLGERERTLLARIRQSARSMSEDQVAGLLRDWFIDASTVEFHGWGGSIDLSPVWRHILSLEHCKSSVHIQIYVLGIAASNILIWGPGHTTKQLLQPFLRKAHEIVKPGRGLWGEIGALESRGQCILNALGELLASIWYWFMFRRYTGEKEVRAVCACSLHLTAAMKHLESASTKSLSEGEEERDQQLIEDLVRWYWRETHEWFWNYLCDAFDYSDTESEDSEIGLVE